MTKKEQKIIDEINDNHNGAYRYNGFLPLCAFLAVFWAIAIIVLSFFL